MYVGSISELNDDEDETHYTLLFSSFFFRRVFFLSYFLCIDFNDIITKRDASLRK